MTIFYFTATGNCLSVAKAIGGNLISIPQIIDENSLLYEDDAIGLVFPIYGFAMPKMVRRFVEKADWRADYAFAIGTYGNMPGAAMYNLQRLSEKLGKPFDYAESLLMVDNFLPMFDMTAEEAKLPRKKTAEKLAGIVADITGRKRRRARASIPVRALSAIITGMQVSSMNGNNGVRFTVSDKCTKCGVCAKVCPAGNIAAKERVVFGNKCEFCLACAHQCPQNAIHVKGEKNSSRWLNRDVKLSEIIASNDRTR